VWDKSQVIRRLHQTKRPKHHEIFTWNEICKVLACLGASMVIFLAVVKILDLKAAIASALALAHALPAR
jgi:hypothetical protein